MQRPKYQKLIYQFVHSYRAMNKDLLGYCGLKLDTIRIDYYLQMRLLQNTQDLNAEMEHTQDLVVALECPGVLSDLYYLFHDMNVSHLAHIHTDNLEKNLNIVLITKLS